MPLMAKDIEAPATTFSVTHTSNEETSYSMDGEQGRNGLILRFRSHPTGPSSI